MFYCIQHGVKHHLSQTWATSLLKTVCESLPERGITKPEKCHSHMIRKTRAMDLYQSGVPLPYIQQLLGHKQISTTSGFYAFATIDMLKKAIEKAETISSPHGEKKWTDPETMEKLMRL